jgi:hypothetical protein
MATEKEYTTINKHSYINILATCFYQINFGIVDAARTNKFPKGNYVLAWKHHQETYKSTTKSTKLELKKQLTYTKYPLF